MCKDVQIIGLHNGDVIVFFVDDDMYEMQGIQNVIETVEEKFPNNQIVALPSDMINDIKVFTTNDISSLTMKIANNEINKNLSKIDWTNVGNLEKWIDD